MVISLFPVFPDHSPQPFIAFNAQNGQTSILAGLGQTEEHSPKQLPMRWQYDILYLMCLLEQR